MAKIPIIHFVLVSEKGKLTLYLDNKEVKKNTDYSMSFFIKNRVLEKFKKSLNDGK